MTKTSTGRSDVEPATDFILPGISKQGRYREVPPKKIPLEVWLPFLGLYLAEGSTTIYKSGSYVVQICHFDRANINQLKALLTPYFNVLVYPEQGKLRINDKQLAILEAVR